MSFLSNIHSGLLIAGITRKWHVFGQMKYKAPRDEKWPKESSADVGAQFLDKHSQ